MQITKVSEAGRKALENREGRTLTAYKDTVGVWTIGTGHTGRMAPPKVYQGMRITIAQADQFLAADLAPVEAEIIKRVTIPITQNEFDAIASWLFNVGVGALRKSTILKKLNLGDVKGAADAFDLYHKPPEITGRRNSEKAQFLTPDATTPIVAEKRVETLVAKAAVSEKKAATASKTVVVSPVAIGTTAIVATAVHAPHMLGFWSFAGAAALLSAIGAGAYAAFHNTKAQTLSANAGKQLGA